MARQSKIEEVLTLVMKARESSLGRRKDAERLKQPCKDQGKSIPAKYKGSEARRSLVVGGAERRPVAKECCELEERYKV